MSNSGIKIITETPSGQPPENRTGQPPGDWAGQPPEDWARDVHMQQILISAIVHDIKTPLRYFMWTVKALQQDLSRGEFPASIHDMTTLMYGSAERMHNMVEELLRYSRMQRSAGRQDRMKPVDLYKLVAAKTALFEPIALSKQVRIENQVERGTMICTDTECASVILHNVLDNAVKFTLVGHVRIKAKIAGACLQLEITDTGGGMSREYIDWCNKEIVNTSGILTEDDFRPPGLGLLLVRDLLVKVKGKLQVSRGQHTGTTVVLEFPITC
jgi:signal transduction histidine kinase